MPLNQTWRSEDQTNEEGSHFQSTRTTLSQELNTRRNTNKNSHECSEYPSRPSPTGYQQPQIQTACPEPSLVPRQQSQILIIPSGPLLLMGQQQIQIVGNPHQGLSSENSLNGGSQWTTQNITGEKTHRCSQCGKVFSKKLCLEKHERRHSEEKSYRCVTCGMSFKYQYILTNHNRTHTGEKPYQCSQCGQAFAKKNVLTRHYRLHTRKKLYQCPMSEKPFTSNKEKQHSPLEIKVEEELEKRKHSPLDIKDETDSEEQKPDILTGKLLSALGNTYTLKFCFFLNSLLCFAIRENIPTY